MREVNLIDLVAGLGQHRALLQRDGRQVWKQAVEMIARQRSEQFIVQRETGLSNRDLHCGIPPGRSGRFTAGMKGRSETAIRGKLVYRDNTAALSVR
jgi:hypothetical protein